MVTTQKPRLHVEKRGFFYQIVHTAQCFDTCFVQKVECNNFWENFEKTLDIYTPMWYNIGVRQRGNPEKKGSEEMTEGMTENQTKRLIEWLKANGMNADKIVECMDYINTNTKH